MVEISLQTIADELGCLFEDFVNFVDRETGEVLSLEQSAMDAAEEGPEEESEDIEEYELARRIIEGGDRYVELPGQGDINEWEIMRSFAEGAEPPRVKSELMDAIHGGGAFRHFKATVRRHGIEQRWFDYRDQALREIAREWCEEHGIPYRQ